MHGHEFASTAIPEPARRLGLTSRIAPIIVVRAHA